MIHKAIVGRLTANGTQTQALVAGRVEPGFTPTTVCPAVAYDDDAGTEGDTYAGKDGLTRYDVVLHAIGETKVQAATIAAAIKADIDGRSGTWGGLDVRAVFCEAGGTQSIPLDEEGTVRRYVVSINAEFWVRT